MNQPAIVVVGSANMDLVVSASDLPRPGETVLGRDFMTVGGGKGANQAIAAARAGAGCAMIGAIGDDGFGTRLRAGLADAGVDVTGLRTAAGPSGVAMIAVDDAGENFIVVAPGANDTLTGLTDTDRRRIRDADTLVCQLEVPLPVVAQAVEEAAAADTTVVLNAAPARKLPAEILTAVDVLVVNEVEAAMLAGSDESAPEPLLEALLAMVPRVVMTVGAKGCWHADRDGTTHFAAPAVTAVDSTAAGDSFTGALAVALAAGREPAEAAKWACAAGSVTVQRRGAGVSLPTREEIDRRFEEFYR